MTSRAFCYMAILLFYLFSPADTLLAKAKPGLEGSWVLDVEASKKLQPKKSERSILSSVSTSTSVSVGGIPLPKSGSGTYPESKRKGKDPDVLFCKGMTITAAEDAVRIDYDGLGAKTFHIGNVKGRKTRYSGKRMTTSYESTSRRVSQTYTIENPDKLIVTVKMKPNSGSKRVVKKVFQRKKLQSPD